MIVVTGATGNVGRVVVTELAASGVAVTAVSRRGAELPGAPAGVRSVGADLDRPDTLKEAFHGADGLFLLVAGGDPAGVVEAAKAAGVRRIVLLSSQGAATRPESYPHPRAFEGAVRASGLEWTILRPGGFASNAFMWAESVRARRVIAAPFADVALPVVHPADIGAVAAAVLTGDGHAGRSYVLTGPVAISPRRQAAAVADVLGEPVAFEELTRDQARAGLVQVMPEAVADSTLDILGSPNKAERQVSSDIESILGRAARPFRDWVAENALAFGPRG